MIFQKSNNMNIFDYFNKDIKRNILSEKEYNGDHMLMPPIEWRSYKENYKKHYTSEQIAYLFDHGFLEKYQKTGASWEYDWCEYWQFTDKGRALREWYNRTSIWNYLYYKLRIFTIKYKWQALRIKMGHRYDWQEYEGLDIDEI